MTSLPDKSVRGLLTACEAEKRRLAALLDGSRSRGVSPLRDEETSALRGLVLHVPEPWSAETVVGRASRALELLAVEAANRKDEGTALVLRRCATVIEAAVRHHQAQTARRVGK